MKESPILFNGDMVRAILDGRKTQTRRNINRVVGIGSVTEFQMSDTKHCNWMMRNKHHLSNDITHEDLLDRHPLGKIGDRLWVKETWRTYKSLDHLPPRSIAPSAGVQYEALGTNLPGDKGDFLLGMGKIRPSIFMPKWAARIWLEITDVGIVLLKHLSDNEALQEGIPGLDAHGNRPTSATAQYPNAYRAEFGQLWASIYGQESWDSNPWVWAITFKRVTP